MRIGFDGFKNLGFKAKEIRLTGGGSKSPLWRSIAANVMNLPVRVPANAEAAALGAAIQALWCLQTQQRTQNSNKNFIKYLVEEHVAMEGGLTVKPDSKTAAAYSRAYAEYSRYLGALSPLYK